MGTDHPGVEASLSPVILIIHGKDDQKTAIPCKSNFAPMSSHFFVAARLAINNGRR